MGLIAGWTPMTGQGNGSNSDARKFGTHRRPWVMADNSETFFPTTSGRYTPARHFKRADIAFVDHHAEAVHTNDYSRLAAEDSNSRDHFAASKVEWSKSRKVYWYPYSGAPE